MNTSHSFRPNLSAMANAAVGAVVIKDIPYNTLVGGVTAEKIKDIENEVEETA